MPWESLGIDHRWGACLEKVLGSRGLELDSLGGTGLEKLEGADRLEKLRAQANPIFCTYR